jgi:hypothetical protein
MTAKTAFGVDQKIPSSHNALAPLESTLNHNTSSTMPLDHNIAARIAAIRTMYKNIRRLASVDEGIRWDRQSRLMRNS